jgi:hypothetical protein
VKEIGNGERRAIDASSRLACLGRGLILALVDADTGKVPVLLTF